MSRHYEQLYQLARDLHAAQLDMPRALQTTLVHTAHMIGLEQGYLVTFKDHNAIDEVFAIQPDGVGHDALWEALLRHGLIGHVYHGDRMVVIRDLQHDPRWTHLSKEPIFERTGSAIGIPISQGMQTHGVMLLLHPDVDFFTREHQTLLREVSDMASMAISNTRELERLRTEDTRYQALFENTPFPILLTDLRGNVVDVNFEASHFFGKARGHYVGKPLAMLELGGLSEYDVRQIPADDSVYFRSNVYNADHQEVPLLVRARYMTVNGLQVIEWLLQDISAQFQLEQLRRDLSSMVYHDLRGPLANILGSILKLGQVLNQHDNPAVPRLLHLGLRSAQQLQRLIDSLLDIQRLEEGQTMLNQQLTEFHVLMTDVLQLMQPIAQEADQTVEVDLSPIPVTYLDSDMIVRVIINLMQNAIKYTPEGGSIVLAARLQGADTILVSVADSGPGIPPEMHDRIFDKFSRVKYNDVPKGVGLGLAFCRLAVEAHGGRIWVESDGEHGAIFRFTLPLRTQAMPQRLPPEPAMSV